MLTPQNLVKSLTPDAFPDSVMWANFVAPVFAGSEPHVRTVSIDHVESLENLVPFANIKATFRSEDIQMLEASNGDATFLALWRSYNAGGHSSSYKYNVDQPFLPRSAVGFCLATTPFG